MTCIELYDAGQTLSHSMKSKDLATRAFQNKFYTHPPKTHWSWAQFQKGQPTPCKTTYTFPTHLWVRSQIKLYPFRRFWPPQFVYSYSYITAEDFCAYIQRFIDHKVCIACRKCSWKILSKFLYLHEICTPKMCTPPQILYSKWNITSCQNNVQFWHWYCTIVVTV